MSTFVYRKTSDKEETGTESEIQVHTLHSTKNESNRGLVAYVSTVTDEVQNGGDSDINEEQVYHYTLSKGDACFYMEVEGQEDIQSAPDIVHDAKTEIQASNIVK